MRRILFPILLLMTVSCAGRGAVSHAVPLATLPDELHLKNLRQLTFGGTNAEAYWSYDGKWLTFQHKGLGLPGERPPGPECDQIYRMSVDGSQYVQVSDGKGRTTCSYFFPDDNRILYSSTEATDPACPPAPDRSKGYVWPIYNTYQIFDTPGDRQDPVSLEPGAPRAYNAETTTCADGSVIFTSDRDGDLDLYTGKLDSLNVLTDVKRITHTVGYDGGAFFSADCKRIVWRASRPKPGKETQDYLALLTKHLVRPGRLELWTANADGTHAHQVTDIGAASFAPFFTPDGQRIRGTATGESSICISSTSMEQASNVLPNQKLSKASRCSRPTASSWRSLPTATESSRTRPTSSSRIGWSFQRNPCRRMLRFPRIAFWP